MMKKEKFYCCNLNGSTTGIATMKQLPSGSWFISWGFGSPFAGGVCDDGPSGEREFDSREEAIESLKRLGFETN